jgi:hypothetical protein
MVNNIQTAVVGYYGQFEEQEAAAPASETAAPETDVESSNDKAEENESDRIESTEVPAAAPDSGKGEAEIS